MKRVPEVGPQSRYQLMGGALADSSAIPYSDGAGVIESVGRGVDSARIGERVWTWNAAWKRPFGTCAEFVCLPSDQAVSLPLNTEFDAGACLGIPAMIACHAALGDGPLAGKTAQAHVVVETGSVIGKVVVTVN